MHNHGIDVGHTLAAASWSDKYKHIICAPQKDSCFNVNPELSAVDLE